MNMVASWQGMREDIHYLEEEELDRLLNLTKRNKMHACLFRLIYVYGLRVTEAVTLKVDNLDLKRKEILITRVKRKDRFRTRPYPMDEETMTLVKQWLKKRAKHRAAKKGNPYLFLSNKSRSVEDHISVPQVQFIFRRYAREAGINSKRGHVHVLRHTCGIMQAKKGGNVEEIRNWLGHASILSTQVYVTLAGKERQEADKKALERLKIK